MGGAASSNGSAGAVIITYPTTAASNFTCGGLTTISGTSTVCTYNSNGWFTASATTTTTAQFSTYAGRIDDGSHRLYSFATSTNSWTMYDKSGTEYLFGASSQSQQSATTSTATVYKWMLEKVIDTNGNYIRYVYNKDSNQLYPYQIIYTGSGSTDGPMTITFATSTRPDKVMSYKAGFEVDTNYRISQITAAVSSTTVRQYNLSYTIGNNGTRSLLSSIQENGFDDNSIETVFPAMTLGYVSSSTAFVWPSGTGTVSGDPYIAADVNGDGINDSTNIACNTTSGPESGYIYQNGATSTTFTPLQANNLCWSFGTGSTGGLNETGTRFLDVNANGKADIAQGSYSTTTNSVSQMYANNATSTGYSWATTTPNGVIPYFDVHTASKYYTSGILGDLNGDGLPDFEAALAVSTGVSAYNGAYFGNGSSWSSATTTIFGPPLTFGVGPDCTDSQLVDVNGDGLADWVYTDGTNTYVYLNNGTGWNSTPDSRWTIGTSTVFTSGGNCYDRGMRFVDVNGDGLPDFVRSYNAQGSAGLPEGGTVQFVYLNTGSGWTTSTAYSLPYIINNPTASSTVTYQELANFQGNGQQYQDVLSTITYPKGGYTSVTYGYTTQSQANQKLPYNLLVVTKMANHDYLGSNEETDYSYSGGLQFLPSNVFDRKFAGFASVNASTSQATIITYYSQGATSTAIAAGDQSDGFGQLNHPYRKDTLTPSGTTVQKIFYQWNPTVHGNSTFVGLTRQLEQDYSASGTHQDKDTDYVYSTTTDDVIQTNDYGAVTGNSDGTFTDVAGDSRTTNITYAASSSVNLSVPVETTVLNNSVATTTDAKFFYDSLSFGQVATGNQTQEQDLISTSSLTYASSTKAYNSYGLVTQSKDRNSNSTTYGYDSRNLYPATSTNALSQSTTFTYDYSNGKVEKTTNPNGGINKNIYDGIGRLTEVDQSTSASPSTMATSTTYKYTDNLTPPAVVQESDYLNAATSTNTYDYFDGLGRLIQERKSTENSASSSVTDLIYNTAGQLASRSLPYFALSTSAPTTTNSSVSVTLIGGGGGGGSFTHSSPSATGSGGGGGSSDFGGLVQAGGGGGGSGEYNGNEGALGGGGGGGYASKSIALAAQSYSVSVGTGGASGSGGGGAGGSGLNPGGAGGGANANGGGGGGSTAAGSAGSSTSGSGTGGTSGGGGGGGGVSQPQAGGNAGDGTAGGAAGNPASGGGKGAGGGGDSTTGGPGGGGGGLGVGGNTNSYGGGGGAGGDVLFGNGAGGGGGGNGSGGNGVGSTGGNGGAGNNGGNGGSGAHAASGGTAGTGGSGGGTYSATYGMGGAAGSNGSAGAVIITYPTASAASYTCGGTTTTSGTSTLCTFTSNGTFTVIGNGSSSFATTTASLFSKYTYDPLGRVSTVVNAVGTTTNAYAGWTTTVTDPNGNIKDYIVDAYKNLVQVVEHGATSNATTIYTYDAANNLTNITDALGNARNFTYDGLGDRLTAEDLHAVGDSTFGFWSYSYDAAGNLISQTDPKSQVVTHTYDALNRPLTEAWTGQGTQVTNKYDSCTNGIGQLCSASSTAALDTYAYDVLGHTVGATTTISGTNYGLAYGYDRQGNTTSVTNNSDNSQVNYTYNAAGLVSGVNRKIGGVNSLIASMFSFSPTNQMGQVVFGSNASTTYSYNAAALYRLMRIYTLGATVGTTTQALQDLNYTYDADGNILTRTDNSNAGGGQQVTYTYDNLNRLLSASTTVSNTNSYDQTFTYDALGNILTGPDGSYSYQGNTGSSYANPDAVTQTLLTTGASAPTIAFDNSGLAGNGTPASSLTFAYTTNNNTNGLIVVAVNESAATSSCATDKVTGVTDNGASLTDLGYYIGNTTPVNGALKTYYAFAPATSTHNIVVLASASCILYASAATYTGVKQSGMPDASGTGNPLNDSGAVTLFQATTTTANRNAWAVLVGVPSATGTATAGPNTTIRQQQSGNLYYADSNGPIAPAGPIGLGWSTAAAKHWLANYFSITPVVSIPGTTATTTYSYDNNGNVTAVGTTTSYTYDFDNRLTQSSIGNGTATTTTTYAYDAFGNRISQTASSTTTLYPNKFYSIISTVNGGTTNATSTEYLYSGSSLLSTIDQKLINGVATSSPITRYVHPDNLGSTAVTSDSNGSLAQSFDYAPYGSVLASTNTGTTAAARQYIGQFADASGLSYLNARYYDSSRGQFLAQDPVFLGNPSQENLTDPQSLNSYSYSDDNPIVKSDPNGKQLASLAASYGTGYLLGGETGPFDIVVGTAIGTGLFIATNSSLNYEPSAPGYPQVFQESIGQGYNTDPEFRGDPPPGWWGKIVKTGITVGLSTLAANELANSDLQNDINQIGSTLAARRDNLPSPTMVNNLGFPQTSYNSGYLTTSEFHTACGALCAAPQTPVVSSGGSGSGGGSLPATVSQGGATYYRNSSGLLSTAPGH
jgi:RHS repeat-associated protein